LKYYEKSYYDEGLDCREGGREGGLNCHSNV
jgi:hypothetical protein